MSINIHHALTISRTYNIMMTRPAMPTGASPPDDDIKDFALTVNIYRRRKQLQAYSSSSISPLMYVGRYFFMFILSKLMVNLAHTFNIALGAFEIWQYTK